ncbi:ketosteroid isomerase family protein [Nonomuraea purpurea]|uniref:Ketosteroid isomerase family protein n=1 Tax=Nonomuraea purpurea TaxID=1849276 RepID=A0ABV8G700_9ACTN
MSEVNDRARWVLDEYNSTFDTNRPGLKDLYKLDSTLIFESSQAEGTEDIVEKLVGLPLSDRKIDTADMLPAGVDHVVAVMTGTVKIDDQRQPTSFAQTLILARGYDDDYYVVRDIFKLIH